MIQAKQKAYYLYLAGVAAGMSFALARGDTPYLILDAIADGLAGFIIAVFVAHLWFGAPGAPRDPRNLAGWVLALITHGLGCALALFLYFAMQAVCVTYSDMRQRRNVADVILSAGNLRQAIADRLIAKRSLAGVDAGKVLDGRDATLSKAVRSDGAFSVQGFVDSSAFGTPRSSFEVAFRPILQADGKVEWRCGLLVEPLIWHSRGTAVFPATCRQRVATLDEL